MSRVVRVDEQRHLMRPEGPFDLQAVHDLGSGPAFRERNTIIGQRGRVVWPSVRASRWMR